MNKVQAYNKIAFKIRDYGAMNLIIRAGEMQEIALAIGDEVMFWRYHLIVLRVLAYRVRLLGRYDQ